MLLTHREARRVKDLIGPALLDRLVDRPVRDGERLLEVAMMAGAMAGETRVGYFIRADESTRLPAIVAELT